MFREVNDQPDPDILLVHGAWAGSWCWATTIRHLADRGVTAEALDLPGHGNRPRRTDVSLGAYADAVVARLRVVSKPVVLVGHSFGGIVISQAAEEAPAAISALTYLAAVLVPSGTSFLMAAESVKGSHALSNLSFSDDGATVSVEPAAAHQALALELPRTRFGELARRFQAEPTAPLTEPLAVTDQVWGRVPRYYIETKADQAIPLAAQRAMQSAIPVEETFSLDTGHLPMASDPRGVTEILIRILERCRVSHR